VFTDMLSLPQFRDLLDGAHTNIDKAGTEVLASGFSRDRLRAFAFARPDLFPSRSSYTPRPRLCDHTRRNLSAISKRKGEELAWTIVMCLPSPSFMFLISTLNGSAWTPSSSAVAVSKCWASARALRLPNTIHKVHRWRIIVEILMGTHKCYRYH
jgi:hypothetical protein